MPLPNLALPSFPVPALHVPRLVPQVTLPVKVAVTVSGTGAAGDVVTIYDAGVAIGVVVVGSTGTWSKTVNLGLGAHVLTAAQSVVAGVTSAASVPALVTVHS